MLSAWENSTVKIQRRSGTTRDSLNEPAWQTDANMPVLYASEYVRIEFEQETLQFLETGERVKASRIFMFIEDPVLEEDRVTILTSDDPTLIGNYYIIDSVIPEWNAIGNVHHYIATLIIH